MVTLQIAGLRISNGKRVIIKSWNIFWGEHTELPKIEQNDTIDYLLQSKITHFYKIFPTTPNLSNATDDIRLTQNIEFSNVFKRMGKI